MKKGLLILSVAALGFAACNGGFKKGPAGLMYNIHDDVKSDSIADGDFISLNIIAKTDGDSVLYNSYELDRPSQTFVSKPSYDGDLFYAIKLLSKGDSATFKIDLDSAEAKGQPKPQGIKGKYIIYTVKIEEVIHKDTANQQAFQEKIENYFKAEGDKAKNAEAGNIKKYLDKNSIKAETLPSGLFIATTTAGTGVQPVAGDSVVVNYTGKLLSGKVFDTSVEAEAKKANIFNPARAPYQPLSLIIGKGNVIPGFDEGVMHMKKGGKATVIIPSKLGYGDRGMPGGMIGPFTPLIFELELVNVIQKNEATVAPAPVAPAQ
ncbi:FKBP-type peptidyl-prolyl cis-trans isomerase [Pelobium manganitolerans]|uniref:FKBP-type peptidyl-prolyl cis-trans isomerase n=1 Tax=Pelobium manganitolerans TaxID=1842495 RepID=UPI003FA3C990